MRASFEILDHADTPLGLLCLRRRELISRPGTVITEVTLDGEFLMSSYNTESERALATRAVAFHSGDDLRVLVGGLGLGYTVHAALASSRVALVEVVELLPQVISWLARDLLPLSAELRADARLHVVEGDVYRRLREPAGDTHDLILVDVDHNPQEALHDDNLSFYTQQALETVRGHLSPGGVLAIWSSADDAPFVQALGQTFPEVRVEPVTWWNDLVDSEQTDVIFLARAP